MNITKPKDFDINKLNFSEPRVNEYGGKMVYVNYGESERPSLVLKTPLMPLPYKISKYETTDGYVKYSVDLSFRNMEEDLETLQSELAEATENLSKLISDEASSDEIKEAKQLKTSLQTKLETNQLFNVMQSIDEALVSAGVKQSVSWFKKKKQSKDVTRALLSSNIKYSLDKETGERLTQYAPRIKVKIPFRDGKVNCKVWNDKKEKMEILSEDVDNVFQKGTQLALLIRCSSVWFAGGKFGCSWQAAHMKVVPPTIASSKVLSCSELDASLVEFSDIRQNSYGSKFAWVNYNGGKMMIKTPEMNVPFGLNKYVPAGEDSGYAKYSLDVSFRDMDEDEDTAALHNFLNDLDEKLVEDGSANSLAWFKKKKQSHDITSALLQTNLRYSLDKETGERLDYAPRFKVKIPCYDGKFNCKMMDGDGNVIDDVNEDTIESIISKGSKVSLVVRPSTLWFAGGKFGITWQAVEMFITSNASGDEYAFDSDEDDEFSELTTDTHDASATHVEDSDEVIIEDDDDDEDDDLEPQAPPIEVEPVKPAKKRRGRKKKTAAAGKS